MYHTVSHYKLNTLYTYDYSMLNSLLTEFQFERWKVFEEKSNFCDQISDRSYIEVCLYKMNGCEIIINYVRYLNNLDTYF